MPVSLEERLGYHPEPGKLRHFRSRRNVRRRFGIINDRVDLRGKRVLDLGCSGGYFGFELAGVVHAYLGVDADGVLVERNARVARKHGLFNLEFRRAEITPAFVRSLPAVDVALFLSVFHHIQAVSNTYDWNRPPDFDPCDLLRALRERADILVFETGYPDEGFEWCERLPRMMPNPRSWVESALRSAGFHDIEVIPAGSHWGPTNGIRRRIARALGYARNPRPLAGRIAMRMLRVDPRDQRDLFIARNG